MTEKTKAAPVADKSQGIATILIAGKALATVTRQGDTFGWRTHGKINVKGRDGKAKLVYKLKAGLPDLKTAIAASLVYLKKHSAFKPDDVVVGDYQAPTRTGFGGKRMTETKEFVEAAELASKLKLPSSVAAAAKGPQIVPASRAEAREQAKAMAPAKAAASKKQRA